MFAEVGLAQFFANGAWGLARAFGLAVVANQAAFLVSPKAVSGRQKRRLSEGSTIKVDSVNGKSEIASS